LKAGERYRVGGEPSTSSFASEARASSTKPDSTAKKVEMELAQNIMNLEGLTGDMENAIEEYLQKHAEIELYLLNNQVPASLPWHCRGNINCDH
jgi:hypothetical protein